MPDVAVKRQIGKEGRKEGRKGKRREGIGGGVGGRGVAKGMEEGNKPIDCLDSLRCSFFPTARRTT